MYKSNIFYKTRTAIRFLLTPGGQKKFSRMVFLSIVSALLDVIGIGVLVYTIQYLVESKISLNTNQLLSGAFIILIIFLIKNFVTSFITQEHAGFAFSEASGQSNNVFKNIYSRNELFFKSAESGALISDMMYVPVAFSNGVILGYITLVTELAVLALMFIFITFSSYSISLLVLLFVAPAAISSYLIIKNKVETLGNYRNTKVKQAQDALIQSISAHTDALTYKRQEHFETLFSKFQNEITKTDTSVFTLNSLPTRLMELFAVLALCLIYIYSVKFGSTNSLPFNLTLFIGAAFRLLPSVNRSLASMLRIKNHWFAVEVLSKYKAHQFESPENEYVPFLKNITLENIEFSFGDKSICKIEHFKIEKGSCIGIYGDTGEGKTTFLQLLMQLIPADTGSFFVDDILIRKDNKSYVELFAYIKQDVFILNASLQENISFSTEAQVNKLLIDEIVSKLQLDKIEHLFGHENISAGEAGNNLSGGQKKLVALARALYFDKPILILDEALASLDAESVKMVLEILKLEQKNGKTIIIVSHQKNVFEICDLVYEFRNGVLNALK